MRPRPEDARQGEAGASLHGFAHVLGEAASIHALPLEDALKGRLHALGLRRYSDCSNTTIVDLVSRSMAQSLSRAGVQGGDVDAVVLCSSSYWHHEQLRSDLLSDMMSDLGMPRANLFQASLQGCHNAVTGLRHARDLLRGGEARHAMVCTVDKARSPAHRLGDGPSILADGAASCVVLDAGRGSYDLIDLAQSARHDLGKDASGASSEALRGFAWLKEAGALIQAVLRRNALRGEDVGALVTNNYNQNVTRHLAKVAGVPAARVQPFNPDTGHVWSSDTFIGMEAVVGMSLDNRPDIVLALSTGPRYFGAALMRRT